MKRSFFHSRREPASSFLACHPRRGPAFALLLIPLAALLATLPLILHGCSCGHDFDFHLLSWIEAATQFAHGNLHPHWAFTPAFNAGEPRFVFYPPVSWTLGALLGLLLTHLPGISETAGWTATPVLFTWIALTASGLSLYRLARTFIAPNAALFAAILYLANPYMLFTAYERTAYAELLAAAWIPLLLNAILKPRVAIAPIAIPLALLWLTNAPAAIMATYTLALLATIRLFQSASSINANLDLATTQGAPLIAAPSRWVGSNQPTPTTPQTPLRLALTTLAGTALGLSLAAFYLLPAAYERHSVQISMATIGGMNIPANTLFHHTGTTPEDLLHDAVLHTASLIALTLLITTALALAASFLFSRISPTPKPGAPCLDSETWDPRHQPPRHPSPLPTLPLTILTATLAFLLTPWSLPLWTHAPEAALLQFPWRLLAILAPITTLALAHALESLGRSPSNPNIPGAPFIAVSSRWVGSTPLTGLLVTIALALPAYHAFHQPCDPEDTPRARLALFHSPTGTDPTDEYTPTTADNEALAPTNPPYWLSDDPTSPPPTTQRGPTPTHLTVTAPHPETLILNLRNYPAWRLTLNHTSAPPHLPRPDGLIAIPVPAGPSTLDLTYAQTPDQTAGDLITLAAVLLLAGLHARRLPSRPLRTP